MAWYNPFTWGQLGKLMDLNGLYCQNPDCGTRIEPGSRVVIIDEGEIVSVTHGDGAHTACYLSFGDDAALQGRSFSAVYRKATYDEAVILAKQGKLRFTALELAAQKG